MIAGSLLSITTIASKKSPSKLLDRFYDKRDDFNLEIVNFPFLDGDVPRSPCSLFVLQECVVMLMS